MKWRSWPAYLRRLINAPVVSLKMEDGYPSALIYWWLMDAGVWYAAILAGMSVGASQFASFLVAGGVNYWYRVRTEISAAGRPARWAAVSPALVGLLVLFLRSGVLELLLQGWQLPTYAGVMFTVIVSGLLVQVGNSLCVSGQWRPLVIAIAGYALLLRLVYGAQVELMPEEAYYWNYSRHLDIGYLDHPPMVAWLIRVGTILWGNTEFGVRFGALCSGVVASFFLFRLARNLFGEANALIVLVFAQALPFFFLSGMLMTPDAPLTAAWAASLYFLERALVGGRSSAWIWAGLSLGVGLLSKYTIGLVGLAAFIFMLLDPPSRRWFRRWEPYAAVLIAALVFAPVIVWNAQHDWASFAFQTSRRLAERPRFSLHSLVGSAILLITPTGLLAVGAAFVRGQQQSTAVQGAPGPATARPWRFVQLSLFVPLAVFCIFSLRHKVKLDWTGASWVAALPAMAFGIAQAHGTRLSSSRRWLRAAWPPTIAAMLLIYGAGLYHLVLGIPGVGYSTHPELIPVGWRDLGRQIDGVAAGVRAKYGDDSLVVGMDRYAIASELAFYSSDQSKAVAETSSRHFFGNVGLMYEQWFPRKLETGRTMVLVAWDNEALRAPRVENNFEELEPVREGELVRNGKVVRPYYVRTAHGYRSLVEKTR